MLPEGSGRWCPLGSPPQWVLQTLWAPIARLLQVAPLSPLFHDVLGPLEHSVPEETILGLDPLEHSGLDHAVPVVRHFAGGPVGPDETLLGQDPLEHSGLDCAYPAGQHAAVGLVGLFGTLSPPDCYPAGLPVDCLCLMALFRTVMYLVHYWTGRIVYTGPDEGSGRHRAWVEQYLSGLYPPCVVDWLPNDATEIKAFDRFFVIHVDGNNSDPRCACVLGVPLKMFYVGRTSLRLTGLQRAWGQFGGLF